MPTLSCWCENCKDYDPVVLEIQPGISIICPNCKKILGVVKNVESIFTSCPVCQCNQFYTQKDFYQAGGCFVMLIGIILVPFSYGLSLPFFALIDWFVYKRVPTMVVCYRCGSEFRDFPIPDHFKNFMHHIGVKYDKR